MNSNAVQKNLADGTDSLKLAITGVGRTKPKSTLRANAAE
jgi:hypothetical protein